LALVRCPEGIGGECFFQKHWSGHGGDLPAGLLPVKVPGDDQPYVMVEAAEGIIALAQFGVMELHGWGARTPKLDKPDQITIDLDPDDGVAWAELVDATLLVRELLETLGLPTFLRSTGGKGLHVVVPLKPTRSWDQVKDFAQGVATHLTRLMPDRFTATMSKARRKNRIFIDYLRNGLGSTAVVPYSVRARPGAPFALPLPWDALNKRTELRGERFQIATSAAALKKYPDPWEAFDGSRTTLTLKALGTFEGK
jgi:bifunctional non-homologous end joining protein LigD